EMTYALRMLHRITGLKLFSAALALSAVLPFGAFAADAETAEEIEARKSYAIPALEIVGFDILVNRYNRYFSSKNDYKVSWSSVKRNLRSGWGTDQDP